MTRFSLHRLRSGWPLVVMTLVFLLGLALGGWGGGVLSATLGFLAIGPAYLIQNGVRRRRDTHVLPAPKSSVGDSRADWLGGWRWVALTTLVCGGSFYAFWHDLGLAVIGGIMGLVCGTLSIVVPFESVLQHEQDRKRRQREEPD